MWQCQCHAGTTSHTHSVNSLDILRNKQKIYTSIGELFVNLHNQRQRDNEQRHVVTVIDVMVFINKNKRYPLN